MTQYCYSTDQESFTGNEPSRESAVAACASDCWLEPGDTVWTGEAVKEPASAYFSIDNLIESMQGNAYDDIGEWAEDWLGNVTGKDEDELRSKIENAIDAWAEEHGYQPNFFRVDNMVSHVVTEADVAGVLE